MAYGYKVKAIINLVKTNKMKTQILSLAFILTLGLVSCQDFNTVEKVTSSDEVVLKSAEIAVNDVMIESIIEEANHEAEMFAEAEKLLRQFARFNGKKMMGGFGKHYLSENALEVSIDTAATGYPITITLDYGDGVELNNGRVIAGVIVIEVSGPKGIDGHTRTLTYNQCTIDTIGINGTCVHTFYGDNLTTRMVSTSSDLTFTLPDGTTIDRVGNHVRSWLEGLDTPLEREDDKIEVSGSIQLSSSTGDDWSRLIVEPLVRLGSCKHYVQGVVQITFNGNVSSEIDFGAGECDNLAILTVEGETIEIELGGNKPKARMDKMKGNN